MKFIINKIRWMFLIASIGVLYVGNANAYIINLDASKNGYANPVELFLSAGTYDVDVIGVAGGGKWNAWTAWDLNNPNNLSPVCALPEGCERTKPTTDIGWLNTFSLSSADLVDVMINGDVATPDLNGRYKVGPYVVYQNPLSALANAWSAEFTLLSAGTVSFMVPDSATYDNSGGISLHVVPEPSIIALLALGLVGIGFSHRKKA